MTRKHLIFAALFTALVAGAPAASFAADPPQRSETFDALMRCRAIAEAAARLQCFDTAAAALEAATARRDVVVVDRAQVREGRRRLFGLAIPRLPVFGGGDDEDEDQVQTVEGIVASATQNGLGQWVVTLQDGAVWSQIDTNPLALRPRPGQRIVINRAALGSFMMRVNNQPGIRARRVR